MRGRERAHPQIGTEKILRIAKELETLAKLEKQPEVKGSKIMAVLIKG